jgi:iron complex transport system ATP-binding protein
MIRFGDLVVRYPGAANPAVGGVSFEAPAGVLTALVGPNGSGKSTLVKALLRSPRAERGRITIADADLESLTRREVARRVAIVPQREPSVFPLSVREHVALGRFPHAGAWSAPSHNDDSAIARAIELAGVSSLLDRRTGELSGGEWQRVRLARALAQGGSALVLDEPTTFLDVAHEMAMFELFASLALSGMAVLVVSHQLNLVARFAGTIVLLSRGLIAAAGAPNDVMRAEILEGVYEWPLLVTRDPAVGAPALFPLRRASVPSPHPPEHP